MRYSLLALATLALLSLPGLAEAQLGQFNAQPRNFQPLNGQPFNGLQQSGQVGGPGQGLNQNAGQGGAANADFDSLIDLITSTVANDTWAENGGGIAEVRPFPTGVWIDPAGVPITTTRHGVGRTRPVRPEPPSDPADIAEADARRASTMRFVSLPRLEAEILRRSRASEPLDEAMLTLAGLRRAVRLYVVPPGPDSAGGDLLLAGPAGDWFVDEESRILATDTGEAVVRLDDLLTLLRREQSLPGQPLGCAITPRQEALAAAQAELNKTSGRPLRAGERNDWLENVRATLGHQDIEVFGLAPGTNAARVLVEADRHMKQIGLGAADGEQPAPSFDGVPSYLDRVAAEIRRGQPAPPLKVLRWWFASNYTAIEQHAGAYHLRGPGVRVLSENELLTIRGERVHTGTSDQATEGFAEDFTTHFAAIAAAYPVYSELRNVFDLAIIAGVIQSQGLLEQSNWRGELFLSSDRLPTPVLRHAGEVDSMATLRVVRRRKILAAVSGGAWLEPQQEVVSMAKLRQSKPLTNESRRTPRAANGGWWWDAAPAP